MRFGNFFKKNFADCRSTDSLNFNFSEMFYWKAYRIATISQYQTVSG